MRVAFAGTPEFARVALDRLHVAGFDIPLVFTQPDRPAGRGMKVQASPVKAFALDHQMKVVQPRSLRLEGKFADDAHAARDALLIARPDVLVVAAYGLILPQWVLDLLPRGCLNIHASLLPRWRGAAPIQRAIEAGDARTGITIMQMDAGLDTGDMLLVESIPIAPDDTTATLHDRLADLGGRMIVEALELADRGRLIRTPQPRVDATYARKIDKAEAVIDWRDPSDLIARRIRAFDPVPGASTMLAGETIKLWRARAVDGSAAPGTVIAADDDGITVACGSGALRVSELQRPGGKRSGVKALLQGKPTLVGTVLGDASR